MLFMVKKRPNYLLFILIILSCIFAHADQFHNVKYTIDGDTILLRNHNLVRYIGIDCPEIDNNTGKAEFFGLEAKDANQALVSLKTIRLEYDIERKDHYGRILAYVYTSNGTFVNNELIKQGYAWVLYKRPNINHHKEFLVSQRSAMSKCRGIWKHWKEKAGVSYIGNPKSRRFHDMNCPYGNRIALSNRLVFQKKWDAFYAGYAPCKKCIINKTGE